MHLGVIGVPPFVSAESGIEDEAWRLPAGELVLVASCLLLGYYALIRCRLGSCRRGCSMRFRLVMLLLGGVRMASATGATKGVSSGPIAKGSGASAAGGLSAGMVQQRSAGRQLLLKPSAIVGAQPSLAAPPLALVRTGRVERRRLVELSTIADLRNHLTAQTAMIELAAGTYALGGTELSISHDVTIQAAPGATVVLDAGGSSRVLDITGGAVTLMGLEITGGSDTVRAESLLL